MVVSRRSDDFVVFFFVLLIFVNLIGEVFVTTIVPLYFSKCETIEGLVSSCRPSFRRMESDCLSVVSKNLLTTFFNRSKFSLFV